MRDVLYGERYLIEPGRCLRHDKLRKFVVETLPYYDYEQTLTFYTAVAPKMTIEEQAFLGCNDRFFLLTTLLGRRDAMHPWVFSRCREVEDAPDGHLDLWARFHYKSTVGTFAGIIQEIMRDPEITVCILSCTQDIASAFLLQIQQEFERNERLKSTYPDVLWEEPSREASRWSRAKGIVVKRNTNPKEGTVEAYGLIDGQPTSRHYKLLVFEDVVTQDRAAARADETPGSAEAAWDAGDISHGEYKARERADLIRTRK